MPAAEGYQLLNWPNQGSAWPAHVPEAGLVLCSLGFQLMLEGMRLSYPCLGPAVFHRTLYEYPTLLLRDLVWSPIISHFQNQKNSVLWKIVNVQHGETHLNRTDCYLHMQGALPFRAKNHTTMTIFGPVKPTGFSICYWDPKSRKTEWCPLELYHMRK